MGGGSSTVSAYYGKYRKTEVSMTAIQRTGQEYGVRLSREGMPETTVVSEKVWKRKGLDENVAAYYVQYEDTIHIRRKYFTGREMQKTMTHEVIHSYSGPREYRGTESVSGELEEGTVEYLTRGTSIHGYKGRGKKYAPMAYESYPEEVKSVSMLMQVVGRKQFLKLWKEGFVSVNETPAVKQARAVEKMATKKVETTGTGYYLQDVARKDLAKAEERNRGYRRLARALSKKGYTETAEHISENYDSLEVGFDPIYEYIRKDVQKNNLPVTLPLAPDEEDINN